MKLTINTNVSVDGVMQGLGGPEEDRSGGFERGGWAMPHFDSETAALIGQVYQRADAFLFGRRTYEVFAGSWGTGSWGANQGDNPISVALNTRPKYVASTTLTDPQWADTTVLSGDVAAAVGELKAKPGGELQVVGSLSVVRLLLDNDLVDELTLLTYPVVVGQGRRLFPDSGLDLALELVESRATANGVIYPGLPYGRAPAVRVGHARHDARDIDTPSRGPDDRRDRRTLSSGAASGAASRLSASRTGGRR